MDEFEITGIVKDSDGTISHCGVKGYGIQNVGLMEKLIMEEACSFFIYVGAEKRKVYARTSVNETIFLTTDPNGYDMDTLNSLPLLDKPFFRRLIEPVR
ncbi:hypothetical protein BH23THE1_BH23THE1_23670 [soil metagenome]